MRYRWMTAIAICVLLLCMAIPRPAASACDSTKALSVIVDHYADRSDVRHKQSPNIPAPSVCRQKCGCGVERLKERILAGERQMYSPVGQRLLRPSIWQCPSSRLATEATTPSSNPRFDAALDTALAVRDHEARRRAYFEAQKILRADAPWVFGLAARTEAARAECSIGNHRWTPE